MSTHEAETNGDHEPLDVEQVSGRYPRYPGPLRSENIQATVTERAEGRFQIRLDDEANPEMWIEITVHVRGRLSDALT